MLIDRTGEPVLPVLRYLKFMDRSSKARNTLRNYCYHLKQYFEYLESRELRWDAVNIDDIAGFMEWLQMPSHQKVVSLQREETRKSAQTINTIVNTVIIFYDYVRRVEDLSQNLSEQFKRKIATRYPGVKGFFDFGNYDYKDRFKSIFKKSEPKRKQKSLRGEQVQVLMNACNNGRDKFLLHLLWETGIRIGEALSLWLEDFKIAECRVEISDRGEIINYAEIKTPSSPRILDVSQNLINHFTDYIVEYHTDDIDTNFVFFKLSGPAKYTPLDYESVYSMVRRVSRKTGIRFSPHMMRHGNLNALRRAGMRDEILQKRAGHKTITTTKQTYSEITDEELRQAWDEAEGTTSLKPAPQETTVQEDF